MSPIGAGSLDPGYASSVLRTLDQLGGRIAFTKSLAGRLIGHVDRARMAPPPHLVRNQVERFGTWQFCRDQRLPLQNWREAMAPLATDAAGAQIEAT